MFTSTTMCSPAAPLRSITKSNPPKPFCFLDLSNEPRLMIHGFLFNRNTRSAFTKHADGKEPPSSFTLITSGARTAILRRCRIIGNK
jgi:hypothetical protein